MEYSDIENLISLLGSMGLGAIVGGVLVFLFTKSFLPAYLSEKAKNLASKEDIESITEKIESVKSDYSHLLEEVRSNYQLKHAAVEREKSTKKEVYMEAVEAITRSLNMISGFSNLNLNEHEITSNLSLDAGRIAKVQVVGDKETVESVNKKSWGLKNHGVKIMGSKIMGSGLAFCRSKSWGQVLPFACFML